MSKRLPTTLDEELTQQLTRMRSGKSLFRFPWPIEDVYRLLTSSYVAEVRTRHREFRQTDETMDRLWQLSELLTSDNHKFGVFLCGGMGNGKTTMIYALQNALNYVHYKAPEFNHGLMIINAKELCHIAKTDRKRFDEICKHEMLAIDEVGAEPREVMEYGNLLSPITDLIEYRYDAQLFTMMSTNLAAKQMRSVYGDRIADRLNEMAETIIFGNSKSFRTDNIKQN